MMCYYLALYIMHLLQHIKINVKKLITVFWPKFIQQFIYVYIAVYNLTLTSSSHRGLNNQYKNIMARISLKTTHDISTISSPMYYAVILNYPIEMTHDECRFPLWF